MLTAIYLSNCFCRHLLKYGVMGRTSVKTVWLYCQETLVQMYLISKVSKSGDDLGFYTPARWDLPLF